MQFVKITPTNQQLPPFPDQYVWNTQEMPFSTFTIGKVNVDKKTVFFCCCNNFEGGAQTLFDLYFFLLSKESEQLVHNLSTPMEPATEKN